jgi:hypothetical protein
VECNGSSNCLPAIGIFFQAGFEIEILWELENQRTTVAQAVLEHPATVSEWYRATSGGYGEGESPT